MGTQTFLPSEAMGGNQRASHAAVTHNGRIYVYGGKLISGTTNELERYTPETHTKTLVSFSRSSDSIIEVTGTFSVNVSLTKNAVGNETVDYIISNGSTATNGEDFSISTDTISFNAGERTKSINFSINDDNVSDEGNESFTIMLVNPSNLRLGDVSTYSFTIFDDD